MTLNSIVANFQTFKLVDLLDILIIAFLIYQLLGFVNRTRAGQLAKGADAPVLRPRSLSGCAGTDGPDRPVGLPLLQ